MNEARSSRIKIMHPLHAVTWYGFRTFQNLRHEHYTRSFPERSPEEITQFIGNTSWLSFVFPNSQVGKWRKAKQGYSRTRIAIQVEDGKPVVFAKLANNASTSIGKRNGDFAPPTTPRQKLGQFIQDMAGRAEIAAKLRLPRLPKFLGKLATRYNEQQSRFARANYLTLEEVVSDDAHVHEAPKVALRGINKALRDRRRHVTIYPYKGELGFQGQTLEENVQTWAMHETDREILDKSPFGAGTVPPEQIRYEGEGTEVIPTLAAIVGEA